MFSTDLLGKVLSADHKSDAANPNTVKILVLNYEYPPVGGGGGRASADLAAAMARRGHEIRLLTSRASGLKPIEHIDGYTVQRVRSGRRSLHRASLPSLAGYLIGGFIPALRILHGWKPDIMHAHFAVPTGALAYALSKTTGAAYVLTAHLGDVPGGVPEKTAGWFRVALPFTPPIWRRASSVVAVSEFTRSLARAVYDVPIDVIPNGVDLSRLAPENDKPGSPPIIVFAGRFMEQKDPLRVVEVLEGLRDLDWQCMMLGDGPLRDEVMDRVREADLENRVLMPGWVSTDEVISVLRRADILFMPSKSEGLPVVGVQALAAGLAFVVTDIGGFSELVDPGRNGFLCPPGNAESLEGSLRNLLSSRQELASAQKASRGLAAKFDLERVAERYEQVFERDAVQ